MDKQLHNQEERILYQFQKGFEIQHKLFKPILYITYIEEPEFGCEGRPEQEVINGIIKGITKNGEVEFSMEETLLYQSGLDDYMWLGTIQGQEGYMSLRDGKEELLMLDANVSKLLYKLGD